MAKIVLKTKFTIKIINQSNRENKALYQAQIAQLK